MKMDGYDVVIGDAVFDIVFCSGTVKRLSPSENKMWVEFNVGNLRCFTSDGFGNFKERTLFWRNPILMAPPKSSEAWDQIINISNAVAKALGIIL